MVTRRFVIALAIAGEISLLSTACQRQTLDSSSPASGRALGGQVRDTDPARLQNDDGQWVMPAKNYSSTRYSGLDEINTGNVAKLGVAWTFSTGVTAGQIGRAHV